MCRLINDLLIRLCIYEQMCVWLCLSACALIYFPRCVVMTRGRWRPGSLVITPDILGSHTRGRWAERTFSLLQRLPVITLSRGAPNKVQRRSRRSALTTRLSPPPPPPHPPTQDLPPGQELLPAGLRGRRRDGGRGEAAPPHAGCDLFLFFSFHFSSIWP